MTGEADPRLPVLHAADPDVSRRVELYSVCSISEEVTAMQKRRAAPVSLSVCLMSAALLFQAVARAQDAAAPAATLSCTEMETYLKTAKVVSQKSTSVGITAPSRAMLDNGTLQHEAVIQTVDIRRPRSKAAAVRS
jgi:hypothetical protein